MSPEKKRKIAAAATASMVLLLFILIAVMIYQMVTLNVKKTKLDALKAQIKQLETQQENTQNDIDRWLSEWKIIERARELDYVFPDDKT